VRLVFAGTPEVALPSLQAIADSAHELVGVVTRPDAPSGRGRTLTPSPVAELARELGLPVLKPAHPREPEFQSALRELAPDCCPVVAYGALLPQSALDIPAHGWVNLHFSCLPAWRGAAPVQHAIWAGDEVTGATTFRIVKEMDAGPAYGVMTERIQDTDTAGELLARLAEGGSGLLVATLDGIEGGGVEARPQQAEGVSYAPKITVGDAHVDWEEPALGVDRRIRACTPAPGAWTTYAGTRVKLGRVSHTGERLAPGELRVGKAEVLVGTATTAVRLGEVKAFGARQMDAADWARGLRVGGTARFDPSEPDTSVE
jgi:methionyl-tRNA formyltransferase